MADGTERFDIWEVRLRVGNCQCGISESTQNVSISIAKELGWRWTAEVVCDAEVGPLEWKYLSNPKTQHVYKQSSQIPSYQVIILYGYLCIYQSSQMMHWAGATPAQVAAGAQGQCLNPAKRATRELSPTKDSTLAHQLVLSPRPLQRRSAVVYHTAIKPFSHV